MSNKVFYFSVLGFLLGVSTRLLFNFGLSFSALFLLLATILFAFDKKLILYSLFLVFFVLGIVRADFSLDQDFSLESSVDKNVELVGLVVAEPTRTENSSRIVIRPENIQERVLIVTEKTNLFKYGQKISLSGVLNKPENFVTDNKREFDYINYLSKDSIFYEMVFPKTEILEEPNFSIKGTLLNLKNFLITKINKVVPSPEAEYVGGLLFGVKESLGRELESDFRRTGLIHVVVLSGYNVTIVAESIIKSLSSLSLGLSSVVGALSIVFFAIMTGASATIVRASIMALIVVFGKFISRRYSINRALILAALLMVLHNPKIILFDPSFQLSFVATVGLIHLSPKIYEKLTFVTDRFQIRTLLSATLATQIFVLPLILNKMGEISLVAPITNILVLPLIPLSMFFGFLTSILGIFSTLVSFLPGTVAYILLTYQIKIVEIFSSISFASLKISTFPLWLVFVFYLGMFIFLRPRENNSQRLPN